MHHDAIEPAGHAAERIRDRPQNVRGSRIGSGAQIEDVDEAAGDAEQQSLVGGHGQVARRMLACGPTLNKGQTI